MNHSSRLVATMTVIAAMLGDIQGCFPKNTCPSTPTSPKYPPSTNPTGTTCPPTPNCPTKTCPACPTRTASPAPTCPPSPTTCPACPTCSTCPPSTTCLPTVTTSQTETAIVNTTSSPTVCFRPPSIQNGDWLCDIDYQTCYLHCAAGFTSPVSLVRCQNGSWEEGVDDAKCTKGVSSGFVYFIAGGHGNGKYYYDIELYSSTTEYVNCSITFPQLDAPGNDYWTNHHSFYHNNTIYICEAAHNYVCLAYNSKWRGFKTYNIRNSNWGRAGFSLVTLQDTLYFIGGSHCGCEPNSTPLPLTDKSVWTAVPKIHYKGSGQCTAKIDEDSFVMTGGSKGGSYRDVTKYNANTSVVTQLQDFKYPRSSHACVVVVRDNKKWLIISGGWDHNERSSLNSTEMLELETDGSSWISLGDLNEKRYGHSMVETERGILAMGGRDYVINVSHKTVELLDWVSKQWKVVQSSLQKPRQEFGGAVKIPASMFKCQDTCNIEEDVKYINNEGSGNNINSTIVDGIDACLKWCKDTIECQVWSFKISNKKCWIKKELIDKESNADFISGNKICNALD